MSIGVTTNSLDCKSIGATCDDEGWDSGHYFRIVSASKTSENIYWLSVQQGPFQAFQDIGQILQNKPPLFVQPWSASKSDPVKHFLYLTPVQPATILSCPSPPQHPRTWNSVVWLWRDTVEASLLWSRGRSWNRAKSKVWPRVEWEWLPREKALSSANRNLSGLNEVQLPRRDGQITPTNAAEFTRGCWISFSVASTNQGAVLKRSRRWLRFLHVYPCQLAHWEDHSLPSDNWKPGCEVSCARRGWHIWHDAHAHQHSDRLSLVRTLPNNTTAVHLLQCSAYCLVSFK